MSTNVVNMRAKQPATFMAQVTRDSCPEPPLRTFMTICGTRPPREMMKIVDACNPARAGAGHAPPVQHLRALASTAWALTHEDTQTDKVAHHGCERCGRDQGRQPKAEVDLAAAARQHAVSCSSSHAAGILVQQGELT